MTLPLLAKRWVTGVDNATLDLPSTEEAGGIL